MCGAKSKANLGVLLYPYLKNSLARPWSDRRSEQQKPWRILIVDDNQNGADAMLAYLSLESMDCRIASGGRQGVDLGISWLPHVIVMDISMPAFNGFEAAHALRQDLRTDHIVILAFTALDETKVLNHLTPLMFDGYCQKGQSPAVLASLINHFVG